MWGAAGRFLGCFLLVAGDSLSAVSWPLPGVWGLASAVSWAKDGFEAVAVRAFALAAPVGVQHVLGLLPEGLIDQRPVGLQVRQSRRRRRRG